MKNFLFKNEKFIGSGLSLVFTFILSVIIARGLSLSDRGIFGEILFYSSIILLLFHPPVFEYLSSTIKSLFIKKDKSKVVSNLILFHLLIVCPFTIYLGIFFLNFFIDIPELSILFLYAFSITIFHSFQHNFYSLKGYELSYFIIVIGQFTNLFAISIFFFTNLISLSWVILFGILQQLISAIIFSSYSNIDFRVIIDYKTFLKEGYFFYKKNFSKIVESWAAIALFVLFSSFTRFVIVNNTDNADLGIFFTAYQVIFSFIGIFNTVYRPVIFSESSMLISKNAELSTMLSNIAKPIIAAFIGLMFFLLFGTEIFVFIYGNKFNNVEIFWNILCISIFLITIINIFSTAIRGLGFSKIELISYSTFICLFSLLYLVNFSSLQNYDGLSFINALYKLEIIALIICIIIMISIFAYKVKDVVKN